MQNSSHNGLCIGRSIEIDGRPEHRQRAAIRALYASESITFRVFGLLEGATVPLFTMIAMGSFCRLLWIVLVRALVILSGDEVV